LAILGIPLSSGLPRDRLVWAYNLKGVFTMRSAYKVALMLGESTSSGEASINQNNKIFWRKI